MKETNYYLGKYCAKPFCKDRNPTLKKVRHIYSLCKLIPSSMRLFCCKIYNFPSRRKSPDLICFKTRQYSNHFRNTIFCPVLNRLQRLRRSHLHQFNILIFFNLRTLKYQIDSTWSGKNEAIHIIKH
jgi:hypothetical protein